MQQNDNKRPYQYIALRVLQKMLDEELIINSKLPPERELAEEMDVSRSVVREAIIMLEILGLVEVKQGSGVYIKSQPSDELFTTLLHDDISTKLKEDSSLLNEFIDFGPFELLQARQVLESQIASFAALNITKQEVSRLREAIEQDKLALHDNLDNYDADETFHLTIAAASQNSILLEMIKVLWNLRKRSKMWLQLHNRIIDKNYRQKWIEDHEKILFALQRRDPEGAREAMWQHLENVKQTLFDLSDVDHPEFDGFLFR